MTPLFSESGNQALAELTATTTLYAFDYDGTLAPIAGHPDAAGISEYTLHLLDQLSRRFPVAVVSGRSLSDLSARLALPKVYLVGNHGIEGTAETAVLREAEANVLAWLSQLDEHAWPAGSFLENKGFSLSVHFRDSENPEAAGEALRLLFSQLRPAPRLVAGKLVWNVLSMTSPDKGRAVLNLMQRIHAKRALYVGDDVTDEDVFRHESASGILSVRVGKHEESHAKYYVENQTDVDRLIERLVAL